MRTRPSLSQYSSSVRQLRAPRHIGRHRLEAVGVAGLARLRDGQRIVVGQVQRDLFQQFRYRPEQLGQRLLRRRRQVVDAHAAHTQHHIGRHGVRGRLQRSLRQVETGAGRQGAHRGAPAPQLGGGLPALHLHVGVALRLGAVGVGVLTRHVVAFQRRQLAGTELRRRAGGHGLLGLVVVAEQGRQRCGHAAARLQRLDRVRRFAGAHAVKADAAAVCAAGVLRRGAGLAAVGEQHHADAVVQLLEAPGQPLFGQQAPHELQVRFAVLAAVAARHRIGHEGFALFAPAPLRQRRVAFEHGVDDLDHRLVLPYAAVAHLAQPPQPWRQPQPEARQAAFAAQHGGLRDLAVELRAAAVGQADGEAGLLPQQGREVDQRIGRQHDDIARAGFLHAVVGGKRFDQQATGAEFGIAVLRQRQLVQTRGTGELRQRRGDPLNQRHTHDSAAVLTVAGCALHSGSLRAVVEHKCSRHCAAPASFISLHCLSW
jgi:hypothetical protein